MLIPWDTTNGLITGKWSSQIIPKLHWQVSQEAASYAHERVPWSSMLSPWHVSFCHLSPVCPETVTAWPQLGSAMDAGAARSLQLCHTLDLNSPKHSTGQAVTFHKDLRKSRGSRMGNTAISGWNCDQCSYIPSPLTRLFASKFKWNQQKLPQRNAAVPHLLSWDLPLPVPCVSGAPHFLLGRPHTYPQGCGLTLSCPNKAFRQQS